MKTKEPDVNRAQRYHLLRGGIFHLLYGRQQGAENASGKFCEDAMLAGLNSYLGFLVSRQHRTAER